MTEHSPLVTVVIPAYNAEDTVAEAIRSALSQSGWSIELIVVDDGSTDRTLHIAREATAGHPHARVLAQANSGTAGALNAGFRAARGEFVAALGADDQLTLDYLSAMAAFVERNPGYDIYGPDIWLVRPDGLKRRAFGWKRPRSLTLGQILPRSLISGGGTFIRRALFERLGGFRQIRHSEDYDFWLRALASGAKHVYVPAPLYLYRQAPGQKTSKYVATHESNIHSIEFLLESFDLDVATRELAAAAIAARREQVERAHALGGKTEYQVISETAASSLDRMRGALGRLLPERAADRVMRILYSLRWVVRPLRKAIWRVRFWWQGRSQR
jgi:glycosyltransferase involved in cell wall biosynthesis